MAPLPRFRGKPIPLDATHALRAHLERDTKWFLQLVKFRPVRSNAASKPRCTPVDQIIIFGSEELHAFLTRHGYADRDVDVVRELNRRYLESNKRSLRRVR